MINEILSNTYEQHQNVSQQQGNPIDSTSTQQLQTTQKYNKNQNHQQGSQGTSSQGGIIKQELSWDGGSSSSGAGNGKKYRCDLCGIGLSAFGSIKRHKDAVHFGIRKKFVERDCPICHKSYFQLQKHIKIKHKECKVKCGICDRILSCSFSYKRHLTKVHGYYKNSSESEHAPAGIKIDSKKDMDFYGSSSESGSTSSSFSKKPDHPYAPIPTFDPSMLTARMEPPPPPPAPESFHPLMPGMYPPPFTPFKRDYHPSSVPNPNHHQSSSSGGSGGGSGSSGGSGSGSGSGSSGSSGSGANQMMPGAYGAPPYDAPYQYPPFYMNEHQRATSTLLKNGTKELANILGIEPGSIQGNYVNTNHFSGTQNSASSATNTCTICGNNFKDASSLRRHTRIKHASRFQEMEDSKAESKKYKCHICNVSLSCSGSIQRHIRLMHNKNGSQQAEKDHPDFQYSCPVCRRAFANEISLQRHASYHKKTGEIPADTNISTYTTCTPCDRGFENNWSYERHLMQHPNPQAPVPLPQGKICNVCNLVVTTSMSLRRHKKLKHPELYMAEENRKSELELKKRYKCEQCNKPIASYSSLQRHVKLVHNKGKKDEMSPLDLLTTQIKTEVVDVFSHDQPNNLSLARTPSGLSAFSS